MNQNNTFHIWVKYDLQNNRIDGKDDELTAQSFDKYSDAYDLLEELYGDLCCSDADYGDITYYDIVENNLKKY